MLTTFTQCNCRFGIPENTKSNSMCYNCQLKMPGNSRPMHCGIQLNTPNLSLIVIFTLLSQLVLWYLMTAHQYYLTLDMLI